MTSTRQVSDLRAAQCGFTLPEYVITLALVLVVGATMLAAFLYGARMSLLAGTTLEVNDGVRNVLLQFVHDVRSAADLDIGEGDATYFIPVDTNAPRQGVALQLYRTTGTNTYIRYFLDTADQRLKMVTSSTLDPVVIAEGVANTTPFTCEDPWGNVVSNEQTRQVIGLVLQLNRAALPGSSATQAEREHYLQVSTRVNKRISLGYAQ
jgi:hypothetical protein